MKGKPWHYVYWTLNIIFLSPIYVACCPCICCCLWMLAHNTGEHRRRSRRKAEEKAFEKRQKNEPRALPLQRRALSSTREQARTERSPSEFLRLPREVLHQIIVEVLGPGNGVLHLVQLRKRLGHLRCSKGFEGERHYDMSRECFPDGRVPTYERGDLSSPPRTTHNCISLFLTCREVYCETVEILYSTNTFDVNHPQTLLFLARTIRPRRLESIR
jgi:hypothetical protein